VRPYSIIEPTLDDAPLLAKIGAQTFSETFVGMQYYTDEICDAYNAQTFLPEKIRAQLVDPKFRFFLLLCAGEPAGYAKLHERDPPECVAGKNAIYLERIYLLKKFHRDGLGSKLLAAVYAEARRRGFERTWLSVWEYNVPAVDFYKKKHGYVQAGSWEWAFETNGKRYVDIDWLMLSPVLPQ